MPNCHLVCVNQWHIYIYIYAYVFVLSGHLICDTNDKITMHMCHHEQTVIHELITKRWLIFGSLHHYGDVIMGAIASQITSLTIVYSTVYSDPDQRKHQSSASLAFVWGIHRGPVNSPHKWPVTRKMFPFDDVITYPGTGGFHLQRASKVVLWNFLCCSHE